MELTGDRRIKDRRNTIVTAVAARLLRILSLLLAVSVVTFLLAYLSPVDPVQQYTMGKGAVGSSQRAEIAEYWQMDAPPVKRYMNWLSSLLKGELGESVYFRQPVAEIIAGRFANTFALMAVSWVLSGIIGFSLGCIMGMREGSRLDRFLKRLCLILRSVPTFWIGLLFLLVFSVGAGWFPIGFSTPIGVESSGVSLGQRIHHLLLPAFTLSVVSFAGIAMHTRQKLIEVLGSDYVLFAKARGESRVTIMKRHGFRNILLPAVTLQFTTFSELFGGSVLAESVFSYQGLGAAAALAGVNSDVPLLLGIAMFSTLFVCFGNLIADVIGILLDPRIREV